MVFFNFRIKNKIPRGVAKNRMEDSIPTCPPSELWIDQLTEQYTKFTNKYIDTTDKDALHHTIRSLVGTIYQLKVDNRMLTLSNNQLSVLHFTQILKILKK